MTNDQNHLRKRACTIDTLEEFFAHAYALELEAAERYEELAHSMEVHNNLEVAEVFHKLADSGQKHAKQVLQRAGGRELPEIAPWDFKWDRSEAPETAAADGVHYLMTPYHALDLARASEVHARDFYATVAECTDDPKVRELAGEFAEEEAGHVDLVNAWIAKYPEPQEGWDEDPDPPHLPE